MEKIIYALWRDPAEPRLAFNARLRAAADDLAPHVRALRLNLRDEHVAGGTSPRYTVTTPEIEALAQLWVDSANDDARQPMDAAFTAITPHLQAWLVSESTAIPNTAHPTRAGARTAGFAQLAFLTIPPGDEPAAWRHRWQEGHTQIAIETQSNFEYIQNYIIRPLLAGPPLFAAIVEECFPAAALHDKLIYYDAPGDPARQARNEALMLQSCANFIGPAGCDCFPTSQYDIKPFAKEHEHGRCEPQPAAI